MALLINNETNLEYDFQDLFDNAIEVTFNRLKINKNYDLSVSFIDDETIKTMNRDYRNIDKATDVISFAMLDSLDEVSHDDSDLDLGDIFISVQTASEQAKSLNQSVNREILFLFIHGLLHLLGYDHQNLEEETVMFNLQEEIIDEITKKNPI